MSTWLITGCSSGFGSEIAQAALARGDHVIATARDASKLDDLKKLGAATLSLDITSGDATVEKVIAEAEKIYGSIDILVNNAGYILESAVEEASDQEIKDTFNTNVFGHLTVTRAVLPYMRAKKSGTIATMGSIAGWEGATACGPYCATKFATVGFMEALKAEVAHLGIDVVVIEPGYFRTNFLSGGHKIAAKKVIDDLKPVMDPYRGMFAAFDKKQPGDPVKGAKLIVEALTKSGRCEGRELPSRLPIGSDAVGFINQVLERKHKALDEWAALAVTTDHDDVAKSA